MTNALGMAIEARQPNGMVIHSDQGTQFTSWAFTRRALDSGLMPSMVSVGSCFEPWVVGFELELDLVALDLSGLWPTRAGASMAIATGRRDTAQAGAAGSTARTSISKRSCTHPRWRAAR